MAQSSTRYVGMDGPQESSPGAYAATAHDAEVTVRGAIGTRQADIDQLVQNCSRVFRSCGISYRGRGRRATGISTAIAQEDRGLGIGLLVVI
jgi:hypothetical protein